MPKPNEGVIHRVHYPFLVFSARSTGGESSFSIVDSQKKIIVLLQHRKRKRSGHCSVLNCYNTVLDGWMALWN